MRVTLLIAFLFLLTLSAVTTAKAQTTAQERADALRSQLEELQTKQLELQQRLATLEEQLKPENIEKSLAGVGSTKPEDLREMRRRQLEIEKLGIQKQLDLLADSRIRLERRIAEADVDAYHQSASPVGNGTSAVTSQPNAGSGQTRKRSTKGKGRTRRVRQ
jgi:hypothetical protein